METGKKMRIALFMGGPSAEHDISLKSGQKILSALNRQKYEVFPVLISREGRWSLSLAEVKEKCDVALLAAMHGEYGEDGTLQSILKKARVPFTGSGPMASKKGMDKAASDRIFRRAGLLTPKFFELKKRFFAPDKVKSPFGFPVVVKPSDRGSSVGVSIVRREKDLAAGLKKAFEYSNRAMLQEFISGKELTCGVLEIKGREKALEITEIYPEVSEFFDYQAKYEAGGSKEITPAKIPFKTAKKVKNFAVRSHKALGCKGYSRSDFILSKDGRLYILELNTLPGMTETSLLPQGAKAAGISFEKLLDYIIDSAKWGMDI